MNRVLIIGAPRSGTTLLQGILANNPDVFSFPETHAFREGLGLGVTAIFSFVNRPSALRKLAKILGTPEFDSIYGLGRNSYVEKVISSIDEAARRNGKRVWIEKTPEHIFYVEEIEKHAIGTRYIHMVRSPRDTIPSIVHMWKSLTKGWSKKRLTLMSFRDYSIAMKFVLIYRQKLNNQLVSLAFQYPRLIRATQLWIKCIETTINFRETPQHLVCDYSALCREPEEIVRNACQFLGLKYDSGMINYEERVNNIILPEETWKNNNYKGIFNSTDSKFNLMSGEEQLLLNELIDRLGLENKYRESMTR